MSDAQTDNLPERVKGAKRCGIQQSVWMGPDWYVGWSPRNDNENCEGSWDDWVALAREILRIEAERSA